MKTTPLILLVLALPVTRLRAEDATTHQTAPVKPNIVYILCDDLGYGDAHCMNPQRCKISTPNMDRLAGQGMMFTDTHAGSSVCTPSRYGIMTGRYAWRTRLQRGVLQGESPALIAPGRLTVPKLLETNGYATACIGKWHLGMTLPDARHLDGPVRDGPTTRGFAYYFGISASLDMPPFAFIENDRYTEAPTAIKQWLRRGPAAPDFEAIQVLPTLTRKAVDFIGKTKTPFFLYLALNSPHTPILPTDEWKGKSGLGTYGDFVMETDWALGEVMSALEKNGLTGNTLLVFTSDNGCSPAAKPAELEAHGHFPSAVFRGYKSDIWDGGHRIPYLARWPGVIKAGSTCGQLTCLTDFMATCVDILGVKLPDNAGEDSVSILSLLRGKDQPVRDRVIHHSIQGRFAIREGRWKLELCPGSGGWGKPGDKAAIKQGLPPIQLYDLTDDIAESKNVQALHPEVVAHLTKLLQQDIAAGRSTPGARQANDATVQFLKRQSEPEDD